jgi:hypothetical protein
VYDRPSSDLLVPAEVAQATALRNTRPVKPLDPDIVSLPERKPWRGLGLAFAGLAVMTSTVLLTPDTTRRWILEHLRFLRARSCDGEGTLFFLVAAAIVLGGTVLAFKASNRAERGVVTLVSVLVMTLGVIGIFLWIAFGLLASSCEFFELL